MVLPVLAATVFMFISFGKAIYYYIELTHTANEGSRLASVSPATLPNGSSELGSYLCSLLGSSSSELRAGSTAVDEATVTITYGTTSKNTGDPVSVQIGTTYHWIPFFGSFAAMNISGTSTMRIENPPAATGASYSGSTTC
jgi:hypothetical protein